MEVIEFLKQKGYSDLKVIGKGSFGSIFRALYLGSPIAIKIIPISDSTRQRLALSEQRVLEYLKKDGECREHILCLLSAFTLDNQYRILITEYVNGRDLFDVVINSKNVDWVPIFRQIAETIRVIHKLGIAHRDLKPENIMYTITDNIVILDFGLACSAEQIMPDITFCLHKTRVGSLEYCAPEILNDTIRDFYKADIYSMGVVFYVCLTGLFPYGQENNESNQAFVVRRLYDKPHPIPGPFANTDLGKMIMQMISRDPNERPSLDEIITHL